MELKLESDSYSMVGTKSLTFSGTARSLFKFSDTGGIFGDAKDHSLSLKNFCHPDCYLLLTSGVGEASCKAIGGLKFTDGYIIFSSDKPEKLAEGVLNAFETDVSSVSLPNLFFPGVLSKADAGKFEDVFELEKTATIFQSVALARELETDLSHNNVVPICLTAKGNKLSVSVFSGETSEIPVDKLVVSIDGDQVIFGGKMMLGNVSIKGLSLKLPSASFAKRYVLQLGLKTAADELMSTVSNTHGLTSKVKVFGKIQGKALDRSEAEAELTDDSLSLFYNGFPDPLVKFDLCDPELAIEGTSDSFVVSDSQENIVRVSPQVTGFHNEILNNKNVCLAANRSANTGPFVSSLASGELVRVERDGGCPVLSDETVIPEISVCNGKAQLSLSAGKQLVGQLPSLEGIAGAISKRKFINGVRKDLAASLSLILGLEGKYFTYSVFGKIAELQMALTAALGSDPYASIRTAADSSNGRQLVLVMMFQNAAAIARHLESLAHYLPSFALSQDQLFLDRAGVASKMATKNVEQSYARAIAYAGSLQGHFYRIDAAVSRLSSVRKAVQGDEGWSKFLPLGVSAAASLISPLMLVGAANQGLALLNRGDAQATLEKDAELEAFQICADEWDYIVQTLLPSIAYRFAQEVYPVRLATSGLISAAYQKANSEIRTNIENAVAERIARLEMFRNFPSSPDAGSSRDRAVEFLFTIQSQADWSQFRHF